MSRRIAVAALLTLTCFAAGCDKKGSTPTAPADVSGQLSQARAELERVLVQSFTSDPSRPSDIDLSSAYSLYSQAYAQNPSDPEANFGVSILGVLSLTTDTEVNAAFDEWATFLGGRIPFETRATRTRPMGVPVAWDRGHRPLDLPYEVVPAAMLARARPMLPTADPQLSRAQAILEQRVLPRLEQAIARLTVVAANPDWTFSISGKMQGDSLAPPIELDRTDVLALRAACHLLASFCRVAVAYNVSFTSYDEAGLVAAFAQNSSWLALRTGGAQHMQAAGTGLAAAATDVDATVSSLLGETDDQSNDLIALRPGPQGIAEAESVRAGANRAKSWLLGPVAMVEDWDDDDATPDQSLRIDVRQMFQNPVQNWKALLPAYNSSAVAWPLEQTWPPTAHTFVTKNVTFTEASRAYSAYYSLNVVGRVEEYESYFGDAVLSAALEQAVRDTLVALQGRPDWSGDYYGSASTSGTYGPGTHPVPVELWYGYSISTLSVWVPVITWQADDFSQWVFPDPDMNGLFPDLATTAQLFSTFGMDAGQWRKTNVLDWTDPF
jgi:hypothetical protein